MRKKVYTKPVSEITRFKVVDVITTSGGSAGKPGWGWGAGGHTGPPGQNKKH